MGVQDGALKLYPDPRIPPGHQVMLKLKLTGFSPPTSCFCFSGGRQPGHPNSPPWRHPW